jgi:hypothetical protein
LTTFHSEMKIANEEAHRISPDTTTCVFLKWLTRELKTHNEKAHKKRTDTTTCVFFKWRTPRDVLKMADKKAGGWQSG